MQMSMEPEELNPLESETKVPVSHLMWVPGTELWASGGAMDALNH